MKRIIVVIAVLVGALNAHAISTNFFVGATSGAPITVWSNLPTNVMTTLTYYISTTTNAQTRVQTNQSATVNVGGLRVWLSSGSAYLSVDETAGATKPIYTSSFPPLVYDDPSAMPKFISAQAVSGVVTVNVQQINR